MSAAGGAGYYVRMNGKMLGPFGLAQLQSFRDKGRLRPEHELSTDREAWFAAGRIPELFAPAEAPVTYNFARDEAAATGAEIEWYVEIDGERRGPLSQAKLRSLIAAGKVAEDDLVWRSGLGDWQPAEEFDELFAEGPPGGNAAFASRKKRGAQESGLWRRALTAVRDAVSEKDLERICQSMLSVGRVSMLIGAAAIVTYMSCEAVVGNDLSAAGFAALVGAVLFALQYVGQRMGSAAHQLASASHYRLSSTAFPYSLAVLLLTTGLFTAAIGVLSQIGRIGLVGSSGRSRNDVVPIVISVVVGIEILLPFLYAFHAALHPKWSNVDCDVEVCAGEEGIGCIAYVLKIGLRFVPIIFGVSACLGALGAIAAVALYAAGPPLRRDSIEVMTASLASLIAASLTPLIWYLFASVSSAMLDFMLPSLRSTSANSSPASGIPAA